MGKWSVLYEADGDIHQIGPFDSEDDADKAAKSAQEEGEFDVLDQRVYLLTPDHRMVEYSMSDLGVEDDDDDDLGDDDDD